MWTRIFLATIPLLAGQALAQTKSEQPAPIRQLGGVRSAAPRPMQQLGGTKAAIPFTRMGPTARTLGNPQPDFRSQYKPTHRTDYKPIHRNGGGTVSNDRPAQQQPRVIDAPRGDRRPTPEQFRNRLEGRRRGNGGPFTDFDDVRRNGGFHGGGFHGSPHTGVITSGSGLHVDGSFSDDNFNLGIHVGSPFFHFKGDGCKDGHHHGHHGHHGHFHDDTIVYTFPFYPWSGYFGGSYYGYGYDTMYGSYAAYDPSLYHAPVELPPSPVPVQTPPATEKERGDTLLQAGGFKQAIAAYQAHLKTEPGDARAMRALGLALAADTQLQDGAAMVLMAYKTDPVLAFEPLDGALMRGAGGLRSMVERVSIYANRAKLPSAWLTLAVLMQAEGRNELAGRMVDRAKQAGLEHGLASQMRAALGL